jgi:hypothetical protein
MSLLMAVVRIVLLVGAFFLGSLYTQAGLDEQLAKYERKLGELIFLLKVFAYSDNIGEEERRHLRERVEKCLDEINDEWFADVADSDIEF